MLVQRVASSHLFNKAPKLRELLLFICERGLRDRSGGLSEREIAVRVFNRTEEFHGSDG
jgi:hypothetical protein